MKDFAIGIVGGLIGAGLVLLTQLTLAPGSRTAIGGASDGVGVEVRETDPRVSQGEPVLTIFAGGLGRQLDGMQGGLHRLLVPGLAMMGAIQHSFNNAASSFMISKFQNNLVDVLLTPLTDLEIALAYGLASVLRGTMVEGS
ncbi:MAG: hypothetical protein R3F30_11430 [Planctomycetota bacterium]